MGIDFSCQDKTQELCATARENLRAARITIVGAGALGTAASNALLRSGCEHLTLIDDDTVEESNLPRQTLYDENDVGKKKVEAAKHKLQAINDEADIRAVEQRLTASNAGILSSADIVLDCTDNLHSRDVIDSTCHEHAVPWVHAAVRGATGELMAILPGSTRYADLIKGKREEEDCAQGGVLSTAAIITGTQQAVMALRILTGQGAAHQGKLYRLDTWEGTAEEYDVRTQKS